MIKLKQAVIVEGKYDRIKLSSVIDATIIETGGFKIFSNKETSEMIRILAKKCGIIIFTDSDFAGFRIRNYIKNIVQDGDVFNAYLPEVEGKEKRKAHFSKEGLLGVEGFREDDILTALENAGVLNCEKSDSPAEKITKLDLFDLGLNGKQNSKERREIILKKLNLPTHLSSSAIPSVLNSIISRDDFFSLVKNTFNE